LASKTISTILNLKDNFSETIRKTTSNTATFTKGIKDSETSVGKMKNSVLDAFGTIKNSVLSGIGLGAGLDIFEGAKDGFSEIVNFGSDLQKSLNGVMASSGLAETGMGRMKNVMLDIYNDNFGKDFEDIGDALKSVGQQTGYTGDDLKSLTEDALALRDTFGFDVGESVRSASMLMKQFGISGDEAFNLISQGKQSGLDFSGEMLDSINEYSVQFKKLGLNAEDMFNVLNNGSFEGAFNLDKVGDAVKEFSIRAIDGSKTTSDGFTQLGFNADKLAARFAQGGDTAKGAFEEVVASLSNMKDPLKQSQVGVELFGTQFEDLGITAITSLGDLNGDMNQTYNALQNINSVKYNDVGSAFEGIKRNIKTSVLIPISDEVLPRLNEFGGWFLNNIPSIKERVSGITKSFIDIGSSIIDTDLPAVKDLVDAGKSLGNTIFNSVKPAFDAIVPDNWNSVGGAIKDILVEAKDTFNFINDHWGLIAPIIGGIVLGLAEWKIACIAVEIATGVVTLATGAWSTIELMIWGIKNATNAWEAAQWLLNVAFDANPIGATIIVITALGVAIYEVVTHFKQICEWAKKAWDGFKKFLGLDGSSVNVSMNASRTSTITDDNGNIIRTNSPENATGTQYWKGGLTTVGEHGKELIDLPSGSKVYTASQTQKTLSSGQDVKVYVTVQGNVIGNEEYADYLGNHIVGKVKLALGNM